jgi:hypothetical protein
MTLLLPFWQRLLITIIVMLATSYIAGFASVRFTMLLLC